MSEVDVIPLPAVLTPPTYEVIRTLTEGASAKVRLVRNTLLDRDEVRKTIDVHGVRDAIPYQEPKLLEAIKHDHVVRVHDAHHERGEGVKGLVTFSMPYYEEGSLSKAITDGSRRFSIRAAIVLTLQVLDALGYIHERLHYVHRDVKPGNVLLAKGAAEALLTDFGAAAKMDHEGTVAAIIGTPLYMPPEYFTVGRLGRTADIYALGLTLFEMVNGPFAYAANPPPVVIPRLRAGRRALRDADLESAPHIPRALRHAISKAIRVDHRERFQRAAEMAVALGNIRTIDWEITPDGWTGTDLHGRAYRVTNVSSGTDIILSATRRIGSGRWRRLPGLRDLRVDAGDRPAQAAFFDAITDQFVH